MKRKSIITISLLFLVGVSLYFVSGTYAKYTSTVSANATATVAKWNFATDNNITTLAINYTNTPHATSVKNNTIAPGTSGSFAIALKNTSDVAANFTLSLGTITNKPTNLKFYKDSSFTTEITPGSTNITGILKANDTTGLTVNIYWRWLYETTEGDDEDTTDGIAGESLTIPVTIVGTQAEPSTTAVTSAIN